MYDRKTWVILALCGSLLAVNLYYSAKTKAAFDAERARTEALQKSIAPSPDVPVVTTAGLTVDPPPPPTEEETVVLENKEVIFTLTNIGGGIKYAEFKNEFTVGSKTELVQINHFGGGPIGGLVGANETLENIPYALNADESVPGQKAVFIAKLPSGLIAKKTFSLAESKKDGAPDWWDKILASFGFTQAQGKGDSYLLNFELKLENTLTTPANLNQWSLFLGEASPLYQAEVADQTGFFWSENGSITFENGAAFKGGMIIGAAKSLIRSDTQKPVLFAGVTNQFFTTVIRPLEPTVTNVWARPSMVALTPNATPVTAVSAGLHLPPVTLKTGEPISLNYLVFIGPKHNPMLHKMEAVWGTGWSDVMQYGWFWWVSGPLNWLLNFFHNIFDKISTTGSWGLAIIFLTITVRIIIWPLHAKSTHTMKRMAKLQPEMLKIKEKYADDPTKINTETMGLYRKYGINPLGGCLPMFIQIPIFFGFYRMLQYAVELRGHGFLWVDDLSQPDTLTHLSFLGGIPLNILPIVMAITSFLQIRMTPMTGDPMQRKIIMFMPFMFFFFCYNFASALALYWTTQNIFSIGQTWLMSKVPEPELKARTGIEKKSWVQRMAARQAEMQKAKAQGSTGNMRDVTPESKKKRPPRTGG